MRTRQPFTEGKGTEQGREAEKLPEEVFGRLLKASLPGGLASYFPSVCGMPRIKPHCHQDTGP